VTSQSTAHFGEAHLDLMQPNSSDSNTSSRIPFASRHFNQSLSYVETGNRHTQLPSLDLLAHDVPNLRTATGHLDGSNSYSDPSLDFCDISIETDWEDRSGKFPRYGPSSCQSDAFITSALEEARSEHQYGRFNTAQRVNLKRVLASPPIDCLSFRLFHYICGYGPMPLHNLLAIFWVQYLFLRVRSPGHVTSIPPYAT